MSSASPEPGPAAQALVGGAWVQVAVLARERDIHGAWWYAVELVLTDRVDTAAGPVPQERAVRFTAPAALVRPLDGQDYRVLDEPTEARGPEGGFGGRWLVDEDYATGQARVHRADCAQAGSGAQPTDTEGALHAVAAGALPCPVCRPQAALRALDR
ncbi:DUF6233 domain-containing protein [Streptomyces sp. SPB074]|uniref:DUF6233 domain-containing protein n=1 Tax=Streptomyces sp. (strain SPB074) TaxID=465543 RepID=UPI00017F2908|nr:DUF6233 domain-containing protein [Streptomyces sp. SPB074]EDY43223.1 hypothetical protein SSBG_01185 [Streptomyces sp. SPB074]